MKDKPVDLQNLSSFLLSEGISLPEENAGIKPDDPDIKGGRKIVNVKSNQLFTGQFEKTDVNTFKAIWKQYTPGQTRSLCNLLYNACKAINTNYRKEVCPIEVMLYTSNIISSSFSNIRLAEDVSDIVYRIWKENEEYMASIEHIVHTWKWAHVINVCALALGKIGNTELLRFIYDSYHYDDDTRLFCFFALLESRQAEFVPEILDMVRDLDGHSEIDKRIGNKFKRDFGVLFPEFYGQLDKSMFENSNPYVKSLVGQLIDDGSKEGSFQVRFNHAKTNAEKKIIVEEGFNKLFNSNDQPGLYDIIYMLRSANSKEISDRMYDRLDIDHTQGIRRSAVNATISYFNTVYHEDALKKIESIPKDNTYYAASRLALFHQGKISGDDLMSAFLSETRGDQLKTYLSGFYGMAQKGNVIQESSFRYMSKELSRDELSTCISNYEKLIRKYKHLYDSDVSSLFCEWFGYGTVFGKCKLRLSDQIACLNIIQSIIDKSNYEKYDKFLYYVAEEGPSFNYTVSSKARNILKRLGPTTIRGDKHKQFI